MFSFLEKVYMLIILEGKIGIVKLYFWPLYSRVIIFVHTESTMYTDVVCTCQIGTILLHNITLPTSVGICTEIGLV